MARVPATPAASPARAARIRGDNKAANVATWMALVYRDIGAVGRAVSADQGRDCRTRAGDHRVLTRQHVGARPVACGNQPRRLAPGKKALARDSGALGSGGGATVFVDRLR